MKKFIISILSLLCIAAHAQTVSKLGPTEQQMNDVLCECISKQDLSQINGKQQGTKAITDCMSAHTDLLMKIAEERKVDVNDGEGMRAIGIEIGKNLLTQNCSAFLQLSMRMNQDPDATSMGSTAGTFKRIELKGFNYIVLNEAGKGERSFLWFEQFPGSEKFTGVTTALVGKKINVKWKEAEVYLPQAKGYYKVKIITGVE
ncbi:hypothetical protein [Mucilaginibacter auburnensis]|uniref:Allene oxide cyclase barrel-like domain-containing protein n=1 Tax=Mucilaginibacter auburnensis TaxID=1457233 RepID=A0A2H9VNG6_9SPHI|nr:hypothetical protein [Mucilaginibacter auburnensis]PJJ79864.1 hypothetical protein CLV57_3003 [Mucilaginibacter auburnensis]